MTCIVLQKYAATQKMTGNEQARSGHFCLCGYAAKAALTAKAVISGAGLQGSLVNSTRESGVGLRRARGLEAPGKPALGLVFSVERAGRPRTRRPPTSPLAAIQLTNKKKTTLRCHPERNEVKSKDLFLPNYILSPFDPRRALLPFPPIPPSAPPLRR